MFKYPCLLLLLLTAACSGSRDPGPTQLVGFSPVRYEYHFDDPATTTTWDIFAAPDAQAFFRVNDGALEGAVVGNRGYLWSLDNRDSRDVSIAATVRQTKGATGNGFGLMCRADEDGNGYYFVISSSGQFAILKATADAADPTPLVEWQSSSFIQTGLATSALQAICTNDYLAFYANGAFLAEVRDKTFSSGQLGVVLAAVGETARVSFDDILVRDANIAAAR